MNELYLIMEKLLKNEFNINSVICVLNALENVYTEEKHRELRYIINILLINLNNVAEEIHTDINSLDKYIVNNK